jgi:nitrogen fixation protein FixH
VNAITATSPATNIRKYNPWPIGIILFFAVFISSMAAWITVALRNDMDLVRKDYYEQEILFQKQIDRVRRTAALGGAVKLEFDRADSRLLLQLPPDQALSGVRGKVQLYRPSDAGLDRELPLAVDRDGRQTFDVSELVPGLWNVHAQWTANGEEFFCEKQIVIMEN